LSVDGEIYHIESVNVPFPDESVEPYAKVFKNRLEEWKKEWESFVLIEAGVIRGGNYTWTTDIMKESGVSNYYTVALCENTMSKFQSDFVSLYYNNDTDDLHFWWERPNNHWRYYA
tara:strand:+ start:3819 stop:4166 length:348 start_codon:yes stop_codon:yes gene_type:complete